MSSSDLGATKRDACVAGSARRATAGLFLGLALCLGLASCGFQLRGDVTYDFRTLYVTGPPPASPLVIELKRMLENSGQTRLVAAPADAQAVLDVTNVVDDKAVLALNSGGRVREYLLTKRVSFYVHDNGGRDWLAPGEISIRRSYTFNESEVLAREAQEQRLLRDMQTDAVQQIVRRLQAAKKPVT